MSGAGWAWIGGIAGGALGLAGGAAGTYFSIRNAETAQEKRFMVRFSVGLWVVVALMMTLMILGLAKVIPQFIYWVVWIPFLIALGPIINQANKRLNQLREEKDTTPTNA